MTTGYQGVVMEIPNIAGWCRKHPDLLTLMEVYLHCHIGRDLDAFYDTVLSLSEDEEDYNRLQHLADQILYHFNGRINLPSNLVDLFANSDILEAEPIGRNSLLVKLSGPAIPGIT